MRSRITVVGAVEINMVTLKIVSSFKSLQQLGDFGYVEEFDLFYSLWKGREMSISHLNKATDLFEMLKPEYVISHECPSVVNEFLKSNEPNSQTCQAMDSMFKVHQPRRWVFGHRRASEKFKIGRTTFQCVGGNSSIDICVESKGKTKAVR